MMATIDGAILKTIEDGKHYTINTIRERFPAHYAGGRVPKSTMWYHLLKLSRENMIRAIHDGSRVLYVRVQR